jgi:probable rRNA maturation factor
VSVDIQNLTASHVDREFVKRVINTVLRNEGISDRMNVGVVFVGPGRMRQLNKKYNRKNQVTDILSFEGDKSFPATHSDEKYLGEVVVCLSEVSKQATRGNRIFEWEFAHVLAHGTLHLLGHEHESSEVAWKKMHNLEEEIIDKALGRKLVEAGDSSSAKLAT